MIIKYIKSEMIKTLINISKDNGNFYDNILSAKRIILIENIS